MAFNWNAHFAVIFASSPLYHYMTGYYDTEQYFISYVTILRYLMDVSGSGRFVPKKRVPLTRMQDRHPSQSGLGCKEETVSVPSGKWTPVVESVTSHFTKLQRGYNRNNIYRWMWWEANIIMYDKIKTIWKEVAEAYFKIQSWNSPARTAVRKIVKTSH
jgi:hypothetical protein